jgi:hypothetical protein
VNYDDSIEEAIANREVSPFWRWVVLCSLTAHLTLLAVFWIEIESGKPNLEEGSFRATFIVFMFFGTWLFLFSIGPFLHRRVGAIATVGWIVSLVTVLSSVFLPAFV